MMQFKGLALNHKSTVLILRWLVVLLVIFMAAYSPKGLDFNSPNYLLSLIYLVLNLAISFIPQRYFEKGWFVYVLFVLDIIFVSAVVYFAEGINTDFYLIYFLSIFMSSVGQSLGGAFPVAIVTSLLYGWLVYKKYGADMFGEPSFWLRIPFFFLIAIFSSFWSVQVAAERKKKEQAEEALKYAALNWNTTFDTISDIVCVISSGHEFLSINNAGVKALGLPREQIIGRKCYELAHRTTEPIIACPYIMTLESGVEGFSEYEQDDRYYSLHAWPIKDPDGRTVSFVHIVKDISDRKLMEQELLQAQKMDAIGHLAGGVAHDFNNMLAGIVGNAELLQLKVYGQKELEGYLDNILKASGHAAHLTKQLLAFARKGQYQQVPVNVHKVIAETLGILGNTIDRRISIEQHLRANPAVILGDPSQLENALMNLGINARDAMPEGGKLIFSADLINLDEEYIRRHNYKIEPGPYIQISVDDTGSGMSGEVKRHLFEPFFTTKEKGLGTGLGLAGVYGCVKNHGGSIEVYSELGRGTSVKLYLPLYGGLPAGQQDFGQPQALPDLAGTGSILIVDDEEMIRSIAAQILKIAGYQVQTCADGQEAVELYSRQHQNIDLVIMDMVMPRLDGREAFAQMRKINPKVKVLLSSGFSEDGDAQAILQDGALGFIQKPYHSAELLLRVQQALQRTTNN